MISAWQQGSTWLHFYRALQKPSKRQRTQTEKNAENCIDKSLSRVEMLGFTVEYLSFEARYGNLVLD